MFVYVCVCVCHVCVRDHNRLCDVKILFWLLHDHIDEKTAARKLTYPAILLILHLVMEKPGIILYKIQEELFGLLLIKIDVLNNCRFIQQSGFTRQRLRITASYM